MFRNGGAEDEFKALMEEAIKAGKKQETAKQVSGLFGTIVGFALGTFFLPLVAMYAWNEMTPDGWMDWSYLPTVAGLFFIRIMIHWIRTE